MEVQRGRSGILHPKTRERSSIRTTRLEAVAAVATVVSGCPHPAYACQRSVAAGPRRRYWRGPDTHIRLRGLLLLVLLRRRWRRGSPSAATRHRSPRVPDLSPDPQRSDSPDHCRQGGLRVRIMGSSQARRPARGRGVAEGSREVQLPPLQPPRCLAFRGSTEGTWVEERPGPTTCGRGGGRERAARVGDAARPLPEGGRPRRSSSRCCPWYPLIPTHHRGVSEPRSRGKAGGTGVLRSLSDERGRLRRLRRGCRRAPRDKGSSIKRKSIGGEKPELGPQVLTPHPRIPDRNEESTVSTTIKMHVSASD